MDAGTLDRRLTLLRRVKGGVNGFGEPIHSWAEGPSVWARKLEVRDVERMAAQAAGTVITLRLVVRYSSLTRILVLGDRLRFEGQVYALVAAPKEIGRREGLELTVALIQEARS